MMSWSLTLVDARAVRRAATVGIFGPGPAHAALTARCDGIGSTLYAVPVPNPVLIFDFGLVVAPSSPSAVATADSTHCETSDE